LNFGHFFHALSWPADTKNDDGKKDEFFTLPFLTKMSKNDDLLSIKYFYKFLFYIAVERFYKLSNLLILRFVLQYFLAQHVQSYFEFFPKV